ncbi:MAG: Holliday junction resolvase RuvX [Pseudomonadota bacterium]
MIYDDIAEFSASLRAMQPVMGLDLGTQTIGVALSDRLLTVATPLSTIRRKKFTRDAEALLALVEAREAQGLIIGLPRNMDGSEGPRCQATRAFARNLGAMTQAPITFWDERLSTVAAERALLEADTTRKRRAQVIDHVAAAFILQGALDRIAHIGGTGP